MNTIYIKIDGIHCESCINTITNNLMKIKNIKSVNIKNNIAIINYVDNIDTNKLVKIINNLGYVTKKDYISLKEPTTTKIKLKEFLVILTIIILIYLIIYKVFKVNIFNNIPVIDESITYGMLFVTGLLTSVHCIFMCGAINLAAVTNFKANIKKPLFYNLGRLISYTLLGGLIGLLGSVIAINDTISGLIIIIVSIIMFLLSLKMMGIINFKSMFRKKIKIKTNNSFIIGLLNGLMPCGPLQVMQIYALSTGNFIKGALSMFLFCLGTIPLMFCVGLAVNLFKGKRKILINKISSIIILILSLFMFSRGINYLNLPNEVNSNINTDGYIIAKLTNDYQVIEVSLEYFNYADIIVLKDTPVKFVINASEDMLTGCNYKLKIPEYNIEVTLNVGENIIEFTPTEIGTYSYTCYMGMVRNHIEVVDDKSLF